MLQGKSSDSARGPARSLADEIPDRGIRAFLAFSRHVFVVVDDIGLNRWSYDGSTATPRPNRKTTKKSSKKLFSRRKKIEK